MINTPIQIAVIGAGVMGCEHIAHIQANPRCHLAAVVDPRPETNPTHATPNDQHVPQALTLLEAGIPVLIEKPIAGTTREAARSRCRADR